MYIDEKLFAEEMRSLLVARGTFLSEKRKEETKRYWYLEFRSCDELAFVRVMGELKFCGDSGFPSFRDFRDRYNIIWKPGAELEGRGYCGHCNAGKVFFRAVIESEVIDIMAYCSRCHKETPEGMVLVNPHNLHKDRLGNLRTFDALKVDRIPQEIKWPGFVRTRMEKKKRKPEYFTGLHPMDDPDYEVTIEAPPPLNGKEIAQAMFGTPDPKEEKKREISIKRASEFPEVPY